MSLIRAIAILGILFLLPSALRADETATKEECVVKCYEAAATVTSQGQEEAEIGRASCRERV